jgi:hypothetical protein
MALLLQNRKTKGWLISSGMVLLVFLVVFVFRNQLNETLVLWVVILTPVALLIIALLYGRFTKQSHPFQ